MNCSFNIRYKPRTTRAFTKSDLTVYDSAGNTALNTLTVYGKSEVVDGAIVSAGESGSIEVQTYTGTNQFGGLPFATALNNESYTSTIDTVNKTVTFNNAKISDPANYVILYTGGFKENTQYSFIFTGNVISTGHNTSLVIYYTDDTRTQITISSETKQTVKTVSTINKTIKDFGFSYYGAALSILYYDECGIFEGDIAVSDFEPYTGTMAVFETGTPLRGIPDTTVRDVMVWDGSSGEVTKNCGKVRLADLTWLITSNRFYTQDLRTTVKKTPSYATIANAICSKYVLTSSSMSSVTNKSLAIDPVGDTLINDSDYTTVSDFVASLGDAELVYELATPTTEQLTSTENASIAALRTFTPQTHAQNNAGATMTVDYTIRVPTI